MDDVTSGWFVPLTRDESQLIMSVVGLQYYHTCCILLASADRHWGTVSNFGIARQRRIEEVPKAL